MRVVPTALLQDVKAELSKALSFSSSFLVRVGFLIAVVLLTVVPEATLVLLCAHGGKHAWNRLRWLTDIAGLVSLRYLFPILRSDADYRRQLITLSGTFLLPN